MKALSQLTNSQRVKVYGIFVSMILVGVVLMVIGNSCAHVSVPVQAGAVQPPRVWYEAWPSWVEAIGTTLLIAGSLGVIEKAALAGESYSQIRELFMLHESTTALGLQEVAINAGNYDYEDLIENSRVLRVVMNDCRTWVSSRIDQFQTRFAKAGFLTEVFIIDPAGQFAEIIAAKTDYTKDQQQNKIIEAVARFKEEFTKKGKVGTLKIHFLRFFPTHTVVLGDQSAVFTLYGISSGRRAVPTFLVRKTHGEEDIYSALESDVSALVAQSTVHYDSTVAPPAVAPA